MLFGKKQKQKKQPTIPYNPTGNGVTERMNMTIQNMLRVLDDKKKKKKKMICTCCRVVNGLKFNTSRFHRILTIFPGLGEENVFYQMISC